VLGAQPNQLGRQRPEVGVTPADLLAIAKTAGGVTEAGLRNNISVALQYLAAWLGGTGAVAIECSSFDPRGRVNSSDNGKTGALVFNLMEDAATAEISRAQIWQWIRNDVILDDGPLVTKDVVERMIDEELVKISELAGTGFDAARYGQAVALFTEVALADSFAEFFTLPAYERMP
jgi:malate synthase